MNTDSFQTVTPADAAAGDRPGGLSDEDLAASLAINAGILLLRLREDLGFGDVAALRTTGDARAHEFLVRELTRYRPGDAVLSEEGIDDPGRLVADRVWIVDPLDGTREFAEAGRSDWAVHVALWEAGRLSAAAVALPALGTTLSTAGPLPTVGAVASPPRLVVSRSRPPAVVAEVAEALGADVVPMGSAGAKVAAVIRGEVDAYLHAGGQYEWDSAAPVAVARAAGLHTSRLDGSALVYNRADPLLPDLLVCHPDLAGRLVRLVVRAGARRS